MPASRRVSTRSVRAASKKTVSFQIPSNHGSVGSVVPSDEVADSDLTFDFMDWSTCKRTRGLEPSLSVRTRILLACWASDNLDKDVVTESWARSGLVPFDPDRVLHTLSDDVEEDGVRKSGRVKTRDAAAEICKLAEQHRAGDVGEQQFIIRVKELADRAVCFHITESTGAATAKGVASGAISKQQPRRKLSRTEAFRTGSYQGDEYDIVNETQDAQEAALNATKPWECKVPEKGARGRPTGKVCGHRLGTVAGCTKHANAVHCGIGNFLNHQNGLVRTFVDGDAAAAAAASATAGGEAANGDAAAGDDASGGDAAAEDAAVDEDRLIKAIPIRRKCSKCGNFGHRADGKNCPKNQ
jgi:hypothetical protein